MSSNNALSLLNQHNHTIFPKNDAKLLVDLKQRWSITKPLAGMHILHNIPLTFETLVKLESLLAAGAKLTVTHSKFLKNPPQQSIVSLLAKLDIPYIADHNEIRGEFDIVLDCCAEATEMPHVRIKKGIVEITQSGGERYKKMNLSIPVINVDDSNLKKLEGMYGTGEGCIRALKEQINENLQQKQFIVFGFGKVGQGIVKYLLNESAVVTVVDSSWAQLDKASLLGVEVIHESEHGRIQERAKDAFCIIMATGHEGCLSEYLERSQCPQAYIANMGVDDEIGPRFAMDDNKILCQRMAINFALNHPTLLSFLDPIFYAHNVAAVLLLEHHYSAGYHVFPPYLDDLIIKLWNAYHPIDISDIYL